LIKVEESHRSIYERQTYDKCLNKIKELLPEEEINETNKETFLEVINCLKKHENEVRVLRQDLEAQLRDYEILNFLKELREDNTTIMFKD
jgi:hypothetical protein